MRKRLADLRDGQKHRFYATVGRTGATQVKKGGKVKMTLLLYGVMNDEFSEITDHTWVKMTPRIEEAKLQPGEKITFLAQVGPYEKGMGKDFGLKALSCIERIEETVPSGKSTDELAEDLADALFKNRDDGFEEDEDIADDADEETVYSDEDEEAVNTVLPPDDSCEDDLGYDFDNDEEFSEDYFEMDEKSYSLTLENERLKGKVEAYESIIHMLLDRLKSWMD